MYLELILSGAVKVRVEVMGWSEANLRRSDILGSVNCGWADIIKHIFRLDGLSALLYVLNCLLPARVSVQAPVEFKVVLAIV